jgi:hypothetical protein
MLEQRAFSNRHQSKTHAIKRFAEFLMTIAMVDRLMKLQSRIAADAKGLQQSDPQARHSLICLAHRSKKRRR